MSASEERERTTISKAETLDEIAGFWDTHSLADYWEQTQEVELEVRAQRRRRITLAPEVYARVAAEARVQGVLPETLINLWLLERLTEQG